ncbi:hypothetical protein [Actinocorallia sp. A-T 12471]|uniref:hypothetical protein n=1 Tax=Actinocorallia sp. A-T 12471 TaxID=3089813 RepID=UPI0029D04957|nr:hypothetical protein [Actinocorallia sp. A-T 12471]MDX6744444.1 hypothetical protein [Actinocorallia sp. A-T 12471]
MGIIACGCAVSATLRLRGEESSLHLEPLMATPTGRLRWAAAHLTTAAAGSAAILAAGGLAAGVVHALGAGEAHDAARVLGLALAQIPAVWVLGAVGAVLFGRCRASPPSPGRRSGPPRSSCSSARPSTSTRRCSTCHRSPTSRSRAPTSPSSRSPS